MAFAPFADAVLADPYPHYAELRGADPVHWSEKLRAWVLFAHADVAAALRDDARFSADRRRARRTPAETAEASPPPRSPGRTASAIRVVSSDPPECLAVRALLNDALVPRVRAIAPRIDAIVGELLDGLAGDAGASGKTDLVAGFAYALPIRVIADLLDVPEPDRARFQDLSRDIARGMDHFYGGGDVRSALAEIGAYFFRLLGERRGREPAGDVLGRLLRAERDGDRLSDLEVVAMCTALVFGGHETTVNLIANGMLALLRHPSQLARLRADPSLLPSAVEELLRYDSPPQFVSRAVTRDTELRGRSLCEGDTLLIGIGPANRDPAAFPDPDRLDVARAPNAHVAFGLGTHFCPGAQLSRLEARAAIGGLIARFPRLELAGEPEWRRTFILRGLERLPVRLG